MSLKILANGVIWSTLAHLFGRGSLVFASILLARSFDTEAFVSYTYYQLTVTMIGTYAALGAGVTASRFFAEFGLDGSSSNKPIGTLWSISLVAGLVLSLLVFVVPDGLIGKDFGVSRAIVSLGVFITVLNIVPSGGILGLEKYPQSFFVSLIAAIFLVAGIHAVGSSDSAQNAICVFIGSLLIQAVGNSFIVIKAVGVSELFRSSRFDAESVKEVFGFAWPMFMVSVISASASWLVGRLILHAPSGQENFAIYSIGLQWYALALFIPGMISRVILPRMVRSRGNYDGAEGRAVLKHAARLTLVVAMLAALVGSALSPWLIGLYGENYKNGSALFVLVFFLWAAIPSAPSNVIGNALVSMDKQYAWLWITVVWFFVLLGSSVSLISAGFQSYTGAVSHGVAAIVMTYIAYRSARDSKLI